MPSVRAALLDVDGTLVDSNDLHAQSWLETLSTHGFDLTLPRVRRLIGMGGDMLLPELTGIDSESERGKAITAQRGELFMRQYVARVVPFTGARELVLRLRDDGYTLVVASSANARELDALLERADVHDLIGLKTTSDDTQHSKPAPDIVHKALQKAGSTPDAAMMIGDTPYDVAAARRAGVAIVGLMSGGWSEADLEGAIAVYRDPQDLLDKYTRSPLARPVRDVG